MNEMVCPNVLAHKDEHFPPYMEGPFVSHDYGDLLEYWTCTTCKTEVRLFDPWRKRYGDPER